MGDNSLGRTFLVSDDGDAVVEVVVFWLMTLLTTCVWRRSFASSSSMALGRVGDRRAGILSRFVFVGRGLFAVCADGGAEGRGFLRGGPDWEDSVGIGGLLLSIASSDLYRKLAIGDHTFALNG